MSNYREIWPLAFVLAVGPGSSRADVPADTDPAAFFQAGSMTETLRNAAKASGADGSQSGIKPIQLSQWFNFLNCFNGVWRRC